MNSDVTEPRLIGFGLLYEVRRDTLFFYRSYRVCRFIDQSHVVMCLAFDWLCASHNTIQSFPFSSFRNRNLHRTTKKQCRVLQEFYSIDVNIHLSTLLYFQPNMNVLPERSIHQYRRLWFLLLVLSRCTKSTGAIVCMHHRLASQYHPRRKVHWS